MAYNGVYSGTKAFVSTFTPALAQEAAIDIPNLDVQCLTPSTTFTGLVDGVKANSVELYFTGLTTK